MKKALILMLLVFSASLSNSQDRTAPITKVDWKEIGKFDVKEKSKYYQADDIYFDITRVLEMEKEMFER